MASYVGTEIRPARRLEEVKAIRGDEEHPKMDLISPRIVHRDSRPKQSLLFSPGLTKPATTSTDGSWRSKEPQNPATMTPEELVYAHDLNLEERLALQPRYNFKRGLGPDELTCTVVQVDNHLDVKDSISNSIRTTIPNVPADIYHVQEYYKRAASFVLVMLETMRLRDPPLSKGKQRIRWRCSCGTSLYDDFVEFEAEAGAVREMQAKLELRPLNDNERAEDHLPPSDPASQSRPVQYNTIGLLPGGTLLTALGNVFDSIGNSLATVTGVQRARIQAGLPTNNSQITSGTIQLQPRQASVELLYLLLCINNSRHGTDLHHQHVGDISDDRSLIQMLARYYRCRRSALRTLFSMRTVRAVNLVKVRLSCYQNDSSKLT